MSTRKNIQTESHTVFNQVVEIQIVHEKPPVGQDQVAAGT